jgi:hypothetical protein
MTTNTVAVTDVIHSLKDLQQRFNLQQATDDNFFPEWQEPRPELTVQERAAIGQIKQRYDYHRLDGLLLEGTVDLIVVSPLLAVAGLLDPPFRIKSPHGITLELPDPEMPKRIYRCPSGSRTSVDFNPRSQTHQHPRTRRPAPTVSLSFGRSPAKFTHLWYGHQWG